MSFRTRSFLVLLIVSLPFVAAPIAPCAAQEAAVVPADRTQFHLFLLVGQSNMAGRGKVEAEDERPHPRVLTFNQQGKWELARDPLHFDKPAVVGVGLGKTFGTLVAEANAGITIGLIPCAVGGSPIDSWQPGEYYKPTNSHPWDDALRRAKLALQAGELRGILWHQGESDATAELAPGYEAKLHDLIARFRRELKAPQSPFVAGQMGQFFAERPWDDAKRLVDAAHRSLPDKIPYTAFVNSDGLAHKGDHVHFDSPSYRELGRRYAAAWSELTAGKQGNRQ